LRELASFLKEHERKNISDLNTAIRATRFQEAETIGRHSSTITLDHVRDLLAQVARIADSLGARGEANDLRQLGDVLVEEAAASLTEAVTKIRSRLAQAPARRRRQANPAVRTQRQPQRPTVSADEYVHMLECATDIHPLLEEFRDRAFKKVELDKIAHRFAKGPEKYRRKADAIEDIKDRFLQRKRSANEIDFLDRKKVTPW
jgi:hypothetical protein